MDAAREAALQARVDELQTLLVLMRRSPVMMSETLGITPTQARVLALLRDAAPRRVLSSEIEAAIFAGRKVSYHLVHVHISKLRRLIVPLGIEIESTHGHGRPGWNMTTVAVAALDALLEARFAGTVGSAA